jgi:hypothetical protein
VFVLLSFWTGMYVVGYSVRAACTTYLIHLNSKKLKLAKIQKMNTQIFVLYLSRELFIVEYGMDDYELRIRRKLKMTCLLGCCAV